nr:MAG TPA: hypothetical protein [Caudoviricetes sp.]
MRPWARVCSAKHSITLPVHSSGAVQGRKSVL